MVIRADSHTGQPNLDLVLSPRWVQDNMSPYTSDSFVSYGDAKHLLHGG